MNQCLHDVLPALDLRAGAILVADIARAATELIADGHQPNLDPFSITIDDRTRPLLEAGDAFAEGEEPMATTVAEIGALLHQAVSRSVRARSMDEFVIERALLDIAIGAQELSA